MPWAGYLGNTARLIPTQLICSLLKVQQLDDASRVTYPQHFLGRDPDQSVGLYEAASRAPPPTQKMTQGIHPQGGCLEEVEGGNKTSHVQPIWQACQMLN